MKFEIHHYDEVSSTNVIATRLAKRGAKEGAVICAKKQSDGHGRMRRRWDSPLGGLWFSVILRPQIDPRFAAQITLLAGVAVAQVLRQIYQTEKISIKWPNDILFDNRKVTGILAEMQLTEMGDIDYVIVGIGVNVSPDQNGFSIELQKDAASLNFVTEKSFTCEEILHAILEEFSRLYDQWQKQGVSAILPGWRIMNCTLGKRVDVRDNDRVVFSGIAESINDEGALVVKDTNGHAERFDFGEISIRRVT